jgi:hypothetical protein
MRKYKLICCVVLLGVWPTGMTWASCLPSDAVQRLVVGVDISKSIHLPQHAQWRTTARRLVSCMAPGERLEVFAINANTGSSAALFDRSMPVKRGETIPELRAFIVKRNKFLMDAQTALEQLLSAPATADDSDILGLFTHLARHDLQPLRTRLILFTDGINETAELDLATTRLSPKMFQPLITKIAQAHFWNSQTLKQAEVVRVDFVLPDESANRKQRRVINSDDTLGAFYRTFIVALGGDDQINFGTDLE